MRTQPFAAHAWIEAEGHPVDEPFTSGHYQVLLAIAPLEPARASSPASGG